MGVLRDRLEPFEAAELLPVRDRGFERPELRTRVVQVVIDDLRSERLARERRALEQVDRGPGRLEGTRGLSWASYALPPYASSRSRLFSMPWRPAAMIAANARYGLLSAPASRLSTRMPRPWPTTRNAHVRLSMPQASVVGANEPARVALVRVDVRREAQRQLARVPASWPARKWRNRSRSDGRRRRRKAAPAPVPQAAVDVARVALALVVLGHERERVARARGRSPSRRSCRRCGCRPS